MNWRRGYGDGLRGRPSLQLTLSPPTHPLDGSWVREELHRWVYDNVRTKWAIVRRRPAKLPELFSGYKASRALVYEVTEAHRG